MSSGLGARDEFTVLAQRLRAGHSVDEIQQVVVDSAVGLIEGCDRAAIGVLDGATFHSAATTDDVMQLIDELQNEVGEGPCLEASTDGIAQIENDITVSSKWPRLAAIVVERTPVRAMLAVALLDEGHRSGALNVFADSTGAFDDEALSTSVILASFASVAVAGARESQRADQLAKGLETNREIGAAVGILMATHRISQDDAFDMLSKASQRLNRKLRDIASGIVRGDST
jgi:GAF domain-containing protein